MRPKPPADSKGYAVELAEPYIDDDGRPAAAVIWNGQHLKLWTIEEWKQNEPDLGKYLEAVFFPGGRHRWRYPPTPVLPQTYEDVRRLHTDIQRCTDQYIEFPDSAWPSVFATWVMGSYLTEFMQRSPILTIFAPTVSGKGQVLDQIDRLCYRGKKYNNPTPAILFRQADRWGMTFALDEVQDKSNESFGEIMNIVKGSFDGTPVPRYNSDTGEVDEFQTRGFVAISFKDRHPKEDIKNRGLLLTMRQNITPKILVPIDDTPEQVDIRARLMGLRLKALTDPDFVQSALFKAEERGAPEALGFDRRPRDIALALLIPAVMSGAEDELVEVIGKSSAEARDENNSTFTARVQHELDERWTTYQWDKDTTRDIAFRLQEEMRADGELREKEVLPTRKVTNALKTLGYHITGGGSGNTSFVDRHDRDNIAAMEANRKKYPRS